jgi:hypothetical protein
MSTKSALSLKLSMISQMISIRPLLADSTPASGRFGSVLRTNWLDETRGNYAELSTKPGSKKTHTNHVLLWNIHLQTQNLLLIISPVDVVMLK